MVYSQSNNFRKGNIFIECKDSKVKTYPGPGENFSLKLLIYDLPEGYSES